MKQKPNIVLTFIFLWLVQIPSMAQEIFPYSAPYQLVLADEFDGVTLDKTIWKLGVPAEPPHDVLFDHNSCDWTNSLGYMYEMIDVNEGTMKIFIKKGPFTVKTPVGSAGKPCGEPFRIADGCNMKTCDTLTTTVGFGTANIETREGYDYMFFEARCRVSRTEGMWPALWVWHHDEIDLFEFFGDPNRFCNNVHRSKVPRWKDECYTAEQLGLDFTKDFHIWGLEWLPDRLVFYLDRQPIRTMWRHVGPKNTPWKADIHGENPSSAFALEPYFPQKGGRWFRPIFGIGQWSPIPENQLPGVMEVDWVRIYQKKGWREASKGSRSVQCDFPMDVPPVICTDTEVSIGLPVSRKELEWTSSTNLQISENQTLTHKKNTAQGEGFVQVRIPAQEGCPEILLKQPIWIGVPREPDVLADGGRETGQVTLVDRANPNFGAKTTWKNRKNEVVPETQPYRGLLRYAVEVENTCGSTNKKGWTRSRW